VIALEIYPGSASALLRPSADSPCSRSKAPQAQGGSRGVLDVVGVPASIVARSLLTVGAGARACVEVAGRRPHLPEPSHRLGQGVGARGQGRNAAEGFLELLQRPCTPATEQCARHDAALNQREGQQGFGGPTQLEAGFRLEQNRLQRQRPVDPDAPTSNTLTRLALAAVFAAGLQACRAEGTQQGGSRPG